MKPTGPIVRERMDMLAEMEPSLKEGVYVFCSTHDLSIVSALAGKSVALVQEEEGTSLILLISDAIQHGFDTSSPMCRIVLNVHSALDGIGLTAAVATALANEGIPCNVVAAYHHDNIFVPQSLAPRALRVLQDVQRRAERDSGRPAASNICPH
jgi:hypothetical protein